MTGHRVELLLRRFTVAARAHFQAIESLDDVHANAHARVLLGLAKSILAEGEEGVEGMLSLVEGGDDVVAGMAAVFTLRHREERSLDLLRRLAAGDGLLAFRARVAVERWESGEWEL